MWSIVVRTAKMLSIYTSECETNLSVNGEEELNYYDSVEVISLALHYTEIEQKKKKNHLSELCTSVYLHPLYLGYIYLPINEKIVIIKQGI